MMLFKRKLYDTIHILVFTNDFQGHDTIWEELPYSFNILQEKLND